MNSNLSYKSTDSHPEQVVPQREKLTSASAKMLVPIFTGILPVERWLDDKPGRYFLSTYCLF